MSHFQVGLDNNLMFVRGINYTVLTLIKYGLVNCGASAFSQLSPINSDNKSPDILFWRLAMASFFFLSMTFICSGDKVDVSGEDGTTFWGLFYGC